MAGDGEIIVYGAYGHTGRFVVDELMRQDMRPTLAGRDPVRLAEYGAHLPDLERRAFAADSTVEARQGLAGAAVVINCAGPFLDTALPIASAAIDVGAHYLDVAAEQESVRRVYGELDAPAAEAGVAVVPAMAFYGGLPDLLVSALRGGAREPMDISIAVWVDRWWPTAGTRATGRRNSGPRHVVRDGSLVALDAPATRDWLFPEPVRTAPVVEMPLSEAITMSRHLSVRNLHAYLVETALADIRDPHTPAPSAVDESGRSSQRFIVDIEIQGTRRATAFGRDIYAVSAPIVVAGARQLLDGRVTRRGASAPGQAFDARRVIDSLPQTALAITWNDDTKEHPHA